MTQLNATNPIPQSGAASLQSAPGPAVSDTSASAPSGGGDFTQAQSRQMMEWAVEDGKITQAEANTMLAAESLSVLEAPKVDGPLTVAQEIDQAFPPAKAHEY